MGRIDRQPEGGLRPQERLNEIVETFPGDKQLELADIFSFARDDDFLLVVGEPRRFHLGDTDGH